MEETICYICQDSDSEKNPFYDTNICNCKGSNRIHKSCFVKLHSDICPVCKAEFQNVDRSHMEVVLILTKIEEKDQFGWGHEYHLDQFKRKQGIHRIFYMNGNLWEENEYKDGKRHGYHKVWNYQGKLFTNDIYYKGNKV
jgi:hypothetical protein